MSKQKRGFDYIWDGIIANVIDYCEKNMDQNFCEKAEICLVEHNQYKNKLRDAYHKKREWLKGEYLPYQINPTLDFHKLSAIICRCIIGYKPISYNEKVAELFFKANRSCRISSSDKLKWQISNVYVNYRIAFLSAAGVAYDDLLCWAQSRIDNLKSKSFEAATPENERLKIYNQFKEKLIEKSTLYMYQKSPTHDDFESSMIVALMKNDMLKRDFDYLSFATNMFQWQEYTKHCILTEILANSDNQFKYYNVKNIFELFNAND